MVDIQSVPWPFSNTNTTPTSRRRHSLSITRVPSFSHFKIEDPSPVLPPTRTPSPPPTRPSTTSSPPTTTKTPEYKPAGTKPPPFLPPEILTLILTFAIPHPPPRPALSHEYQHDYLNLRARQHCHRCPLNQLAACALVSRAWHPVAMRLLYERLDLNMLTLPLNVPRPAVLGRANLAEKYGAADMLRVGWGLSAEEIVWLVEPGAGARKFPESDAADEPSVSRKEKVARGLKKARKVVLRQGEPPAWPGRTAQAMTDPKPIATEDTPPAGKDRKDDYYDDDDDDENPLHRTVQFEVPPGYMPGSCSPGAKIRFRAPLIAPENCLFANSRRPRHHNFYPGLLHQLQVDPSMAQWNPLTEFLFNGHFMLLARTLRENPALAGMVRRVVLPDLFYNSGKFAPGLARHLLRIDEANGGVVRAQLVAKGVYCYAEEAQMWETTHRVMLRILEPCVNLVALDFTLRQSMRALLARRHELNQLQIGYVGRIGGPHAFPRMQAYLGHNVDEPKGMGYQILRGLCSFPLTPAPVANLARRQITTKCLLPVKVIASTPEPSAAAKLAKFILTRRQLTSLSLGYDNGTAESASYGHASHNKVMEAWLGQSLAASNVAIGPNLVRLRLALVADPVTPSTRVSEPPAWAAAMIKANALPNLRHLVLSGQTALLTVIPKDSLTSLQIDGWYDARVMATHLTSYLERSQPGHRLTTLSLSVVGSVIIGGDDGLRALVATPVPKPSYVHMRASWEDCLRSTVRPVRDTLFPNTLATILRLAGASGVRHLTLTGVNPATLTWEQWYTLQHVWDADLFAARPTQEVLDEHALPAESYAPPVHNYDADAWDFVAAGDDFGDMARWTAPYTGGGAGDDGRLTMPHLRSLVVSHPAEPFITFLSDHLLHANNLPQLERLSLPSPRNTLQARWDARRAAAGELILAPPSLHTVRLFESSSKWAVWIEEAGADGKRMPDKEERAYWGALVDEPVQPERKGREVWVGRRRQSAYLKVVEEVWDRERVVRGVGGRWGKGVRVEWL